jgi:hypothetical protein
MGETSERRTPPRREFRIVLEEVPRQATVMHPADLTQLFETDPQEAAQLLSQELERLRAQPPTDTR